MEEKLVRQLGGRQELYLIKAGRTKNGHTGENNKKITRRERKRSALEKKTDFCGRTKQKARKGSERSCIVLLASKPHEKRKVGLRPRNMGVWGHDRKQGGNKLENEQTKRGA